jgi:hypothetical protein
MGNGALSDAQSETAETQEVMHTILDILLTTAHSV